MNRFGYIKYNIDMELSWMDELVNAERVLPVWLMSDIKTKLHTNGDELMEKMVAYKSSCLQIKELIANNHCQDNLLQYYKYFQKQQRIRDSLRRELMVLLRGEETIKKAEMVEEKRWKDTYLEVEELMKL